MEYALTQPSGLASLTLSSSPASIPLWAEETGRLRAELPGDVRRTLDEHEAAGTADSPEYRQAMMEVDKRHVIRLDPMPEGVQRSFTKLEENPDVYLHMQGPNEFVITGTFKDWDISDRLGEIGVPTLVTSGRHDECTPRQVEIVHRGIPGIGVDRVRGQLAHAVLRGARALPRGARRLPDESGDRRLGRPADLLWSSPMRESIRSASALVCSVSCVFCASSCLI